MLGTQAGTLDWREIPVFISNRNRVSTLRRLVDWVLAAGTRNVIILDNDSDYPPLLRYYLDLPEGAKVLMLPENHGPHVLWKLGVHRSLDTPYVVTDSDVVPADFCPKNLIAVLLDELQRHPDAKKVGTALRIDNLPDSYLEAEVVRKWESQFWEHPVKPGVFAAPIDTTFALYPARGPFSNEACNLRMGHPFIAEHTPWYADDHALDEEERYYREHTSPIFSNWSVINKESWIQASRRVVGFARRPKVLHMDCGREYIPGWINVGIQQRLPLPSNTLDGIHLSHILVHGHQAVALVKELYRVARPNAKLFIRMAHGGLEVAWSNAMREASARFGVDWRRDAIQCAGSTTELAVTYRAVKPRRPLSVRNAATTIESTWCADDRIDPDFGVAGRRASPTPT